MFSCGADNPIDVQKRNMLRLTAKSTQFGKRTFTSWLIESAGTVPLQRRKDYINEDVDNTASMSKLIEASERHSTLPHVSHMSLLQALETGDAVCLFPEGASRYHPTIAPLKTGGLRRLLSFDITEILM